MLRSFACKKTEQLSRGKPVRLFQPFRKVAERKLTILDAATTLNDLSLPGNHLEALKGKRKGQHSIRINDQRRVCFKWSAPYADDVEIVDYH